MLREKDLDEAALELLLIELKGALAQWPVSLFLNGHPALAREFGLSGVHLPQGEDCRSARHCLGDGSVIGVSVHSLDELAEAQRAGADYVTLSPVFVSTSKGNFRRPLGLKTFKELAGSTCLPVIALGGVNDKNISVLKEAGADGVGLLGPAMSSVDVEAFAARLMSLWIGRS